MKSTIIAIMLILLLVPFCTAETLNIESATITKDVRDANWFESIQCKYNLIDNCADGEEGYLIIETPLEAVTDYYFKEMYVDVGEKAYFCAEITWDYSSYLSDKNTCGATLYTSNFANTGGCSADIGMGYYMLRKQVKPDGTKTTTLSSFSTPHKFGDTWRACSSFYPVEGTYTISNPIILTKKPTSTWRANFFNYGAKYAYDKDTSVTGIIAYATQQYSIFVTASKVDKCAGVTCPDKCVGDYVYYYYCSSVTGNCGHSSQKYCQYGCNTATNTCNAPPVDKCKDVTCPDECVGDYVYSYKCNSATGKCDYSSRESCKGYGCSNKVCNTAPVDKCIGKPPCIPYCEGNTAKYSGMCDPATGLCVYQSQPCPDQCENGECVTQIDLCEGVECNPYCEGNTAKYSGMCDPATGDCMYQEQICDDRCVEGVCEGQGDICAGITPLPDHCVGTVRQYAGQCNPITGIWEYETESCPNQCVSGICTGGGCTADIDCNDNNPDTTDKCENRVCKNTPVEEGGLLFLIVSIVMAIGLIFGMVWIVKKSKKKVRRRKR